MKKYLIIFSCLIGIVFINDSCKKQNNKRQEVEKYLGKQIQIPRDSVLILQNDSIVPTEKFNFHSNKIKIVSRINDKCHICVHLLDQWKQEFLKRYKDRPFQFVFYLYTDNYELFKRKFYYRISGTYPLLIDTTNAFIRANNLPEMDKRFHTFLLNKT